jgi:two-component system, cell cycle response regulator CtrA
MPAMTMSNLTASKNLPSKGYFIKEAANVPLIVSLSHQILELLSLRKGATLTKEMFLDNLYGGMDEPEIDIIDVFICKLRKKLSNASDGKDYIETVWGRGYILRERGHEQTLHAGCRQYQDILPS